MALSPWNEQGFDANALIIRPGGDGEEVVNNGERGGSPCTLGSTNCYDRPAGDAPYGQFILGQFNTQRFVIADEFVPSAAGTVNQVCWLGEYSDAVQCPASNPVSTYGEFTITYFLDNGFGFPGAVHAGPFTSPTTLTVLQGATGDPIGFNNPTAEEVGFSASHSPVAVSANTCYWIQFDWTGAPGGTCFVLMNLSYENVEGNRRLLRMDANLGNQFMDLNKTNLDTTACIGFTTPAPLSSSNIVGCGEFRAVPSNDALPGTNVACGTSVVGDNTNATYDNSYPPAACRKSTQNPTEYNAGDMWYSFVATATTASVSACSTATLTGQVHGDSLMQGYRQNVVGPDFTNANMVLLGCSDDACSGGLSELCLSGLTIGQTYYVRFWAFSPLSQGKFAINVDCPCPTAANDLCTTAILIPRTADGGGPGWGDPTGRLVLGSTALGFVDGYVTGCPGVPNTAKGVWYKIVGAGNRVLLNTDQVITGTSFDTRLTVYCSATNDCNGLTCLAANDDINATDANFFSEVEFCAVNGQTYFILVHGFGSDSGAFGMLTLEQRDGSNALVPCCDIQQCDLLCTFEIPQNATTEQTAVPGGSPAYLQPDIACNDTLTGLAASGPNLGCSAAAGPQRNFTPVTLGVALKGDSHAWNGTRDTDWYLFRNAPNGKTFLIDYSFQATGPMEFIPWQANPNYSLCQVVAYGTWVNNTSFCGSGFTRRTILSTGLAGQISNYDGAGTNTDFMFRIRNRALSDGYNCAQGLNNYWFRINFVLALENCPPIPTPAGTVGTDYDDERDQATSATYDGSGGANGFQYEPCNYSTPNDGLHRGKGGCNEDSPGDGDFIRLTPGRPMIGVLDGLLGGSGAGRDVDWYKFDLLDRSIVSFKVTCGGPLTFFITENSCENEAITYSTAATLGHCGARCLDAEDCIVLEAGTYIVVGINNDAFAGGSIFAALDCTDPGNEIGMAKYRIDIDATPVPSCSVTCPGGAVTETEPCPNTFTIFDSCQPTNNGCAANVFGAGNITSGTPVCGTLFSQYQPFPDDVFSIDTDYWQFTIASRQKLTYSVVADGPVLAQIGVTGPGGSLCDADLPNPFTNQGGGLRVLSSGDATPCTAGTPVTYTIYLEAGTYSLILTPGSVDKGFTFDDLACVNGSQLSYTASISLAPIGSCTVGSDCLITTATECSGLSGSFTADGGASCGNLFTATAFNSGCTAYSTISGLGTQVPLCGDNELAQQVIPPFKYYGITYTQVNISTNGYITFGGISSDTPRQFANNGTPNAVIAPFWNDWKVACANSTGGATPTTVWVRTTGGLGNEVTTIEWKDLRKFELYTQSANFQVVLFHASGEIEFRYGAFTGLSKKDLDEIAVGCEDACGLRGVEVPVTGAFLNGNSCVRLVLTPPCCPGNSDKVSPGTVNFDDINAAIANWLTNYGAGTGPGDGNCDGVVNFDDINSTIANWLAGCP